MPAAPSTPPVRRWRSLVCLAAAVTVLSACGAESAVAPVASPSPSPTASTTPTPSPSPSATRATQAPGTPITAATSQFGTILWGPKRQVVYIWQKEPTSKAECYGDCAEAWPPVLTKGAPVAGAGINAELLGATPRRDGTTQVTYNGHPLYYYAHEGPGEVKCHNIATHGGLWWVITPAGKRAA